jgi:t-SNARE complex subunit (syntaxin)
MNLIIKYILQGAMIDNIEKHVVGASEHIEGAAKMTKKAVVYKSKARKVSFQVY